MFNLLFCIFALPFPYLFFALVLQLQPSGLQTVLPAFLSHPQYKNVICFQSSNAYSFTRHYGLY